MENGFGRRGAGKHSFDRFSYSGNYFNNSNNYNTNNNSTSSFPTPDYSKNNNSNNSNSTSSYNFSPSYKQPQKQTNINNNNPDHLAQLQQSAQAAGKSFASAATVQRPNFFLPSENFSGDFFAAKHNNNNNNNLSNHGSTPSPTYSSNSSFSTNFKPKTKNFISKSEFPSLGGNPGSANSLLGTGPPLSNWGAPKDSDQSIFQAAPTPKPIVSPSASILITTRKKTNSGGKGKKSKNLAKEIFSLETASLDKNNNQVPDSPENQHKSSKKDKKDKKEKKSSKKKLSKENLENHQNGDSNKTNNKQIICWNQELEQKLIKEMRERCHDCFEEENEKISEDKMITDLKKCY